MGLLAQARELRLYGSRDLKFDFIAGLTVAVVALPQSMAYAVIAGVGPIYGLYTAIVAAIIGSCLGSSPYLITGPTNAIALMIAGAVHGYDRSGDLMARVFLLTFLVGICQIVLGLLRMGKIINFVSHAVIVGFTAGAGVIIALGQLPQLLGISIAKGYHPLYEKVYLTLGGIGRTNPYALGLAGLTVAVILVCRKIDRNIPGALLGILVSCVLTGCFNLQDKGVGLIGRIPNDLPLFKLLYFRPAWFFDLAGSAVAIALVGLVEAISIAKSLSLSSGRSINPSREFIGQGSANALAAFFRCIPASGSFTRSAVNFEAGARSRLAGILSGVFVAVILAILGPFAKYIPHASLAGVIVVVAFNMVNKHAVGKILKASRFDMVVMFITILATIAMPDLEKAILIGVAVSIIVHLWNTGEVKIKLLEQDDRGGFREVNLPAAFRASNPEGILIVHIEGDLYFGSSSDLQDKLAPIARADDVRVCILRLKRINVVDISAFEVLEGFIRRLMMGGKTVLLCGVSESLKSFANASGLTALVGADNVFVAEDKVFASSRKAFQKAKAITRAS